MAVCLGHPYAVQVARELLKKQEQSDDSSSNESALPELKGLTMVAPFVSPACPHAWGVARLGAMVPSFVLSAATYSMSSIGAALMPSFLTPERVQTLLGETQEKEFGWTEDDYDHVCQIVMEISQLNKNAKHIEANLGADPAWQQIIDDFAIESGCGLTVSDDGGKTDVTDDGASNESRTGDDDKDDSNNNQPLFPIQIRATELDKISPLESVQWVSSRNYGGVEIQKDTRIESHEGMTFMGGPPRNPVLLHEIAQDWGLLE